ncbi:MAG: hypothetical protein HZB87_09445, partial [Desulfatitalea sp.]|nr:hypothetical protein [Desulfatitalea sp.]
MATRGVKAWLKKVAMVALTALCACSQHEPSPAKTTEASPQLKTHSAEFRQEVVQLLPGIHVAIGYGLANSILIEGRDGLIIVDAMESAEA